jgi:guanylate kinase
VLLEIDVQGAEQVVRREPEALLVFLVPPSTEELRRRLEGRGDLPERVAERVEVADHEREVATSLGAVIVVNDDLDRAVAEVQGCIERARAHRGPVREET